MNVNEPALTATKHEFVLERLAAELRVSRDRIILERHLDRLFDDTIYRLTVEMARFRQRGELTVRWPATWWQHAKQAAYKHFPWLLRPAIHAWPVRFHEERHLASRFAPAVELPAKMLHGSFCVWSTEAKRPGCARPEHMT